MKKPQDVHPRKDQKKQAPSKPVKKSKGHPETYDILDLQGSIPTTPEHLADVLLGVKPRQPKKSK